MSLFQLNPVKLASGQASRWKIECDALTIDDWDALAVMFVERLPKFSRVWGVPRGGLPLMRALTPHLHADASKTLVVDDVWTTGGSMQRYIDANIYRLETPVLGAVVFARNPTPPDVVALFTMPERPR